MPAKSEFYAGQRSASAIANVVMAQPVGAMILYWGGKDDLIPGWLPCDGEPFDSKVYPDLAKLLGKTTTPNVPGGIAFGFGHPVKYIIFAGFPVGQTS